MWCRCGMMGISNNEGEYMKSYTLDQANRLVLSYFKDDRRTMPFPKHLSSLEALQSEEARIYVLAYTLEAKEVQTVVNGVVMVSYVK
jgi:hypothetical protein